MGRPRPAVRGLHWHRLDSVPSPGPGQRKYLCAGVPKGGYSVRLLGAKTEIPDYTSSITLSSNAHISHNTPRQCSSVFRSRAALELENLALRHQIGVLQRSARKRPRLTQWTACCRSSTEYIRLAIMRKRTPLSRVGFDRARRQHGSLRVQGHAGAAALAGVAPLRHNGGDEARGGLLLRPDGGRKAGSISA